MSRTARALLPVAFAVALGLGAVAAFAQYVPGSGFTDSPHDFSDIPAGNPENADATTGGCTFCHTPHQAQQQPLLWNHTLSALNYSWEAGAVTAGGTPYPTIDNTWKGPSKLCLSCHDGSVAIGDVGWFNKQSWTGANAFVADFHPDPTPLGIRLFNDNAGNVSAGAVAGSTGIECTSCHGVHNERNLVFDEPLLRGTIGGSGTGAGAAYICQKCHDRG